METNDLRAIGFWQPGSEQPMFSPQEMAEAVGHVREAIHVVRKGPGKKLGLAFSGKVFTQINEHDSFSHDPYELVASLGSLYPEWLGDRTFSEAHEVRFPYVVGAMANGISTPDMVVEMAKSRMIGFFGAGGLEVESVERGLKNIKERLKNTGGSWGANLIHSPNEPQLEQAIVDLYLRHDVRRVSASAYMGLTPFLVQYAVSGLSTTPSGIVRRKNHVFAKISREEVAKHFLLPPPANLIEALVRQGKISESEAAISKQIPVAEDITVEADSGGHTDNRPLPVVLPTIMGLRDRISKEHGYGHPIRIGAAGGLGTPEAVAGAFGMGAAYVLTGSINQAAQESGLASIGKSMLAEAGMADVDMAPSPDMFELGAKVQVLRRGTLFASRATKLYELYKSCDGLESIPSTDRHDLEKNFFCASLEKVWEESKSFFETRNPGELERAKRDPKHKMALVFRWYLGKSSHWAIQGESDRQFDYQIWCGPAMGAFNSWTRGSFLEDPANRTVTQIALNLMEGAAKITRAHQVRSFGVPLPGAAFHFRPRSLC